MKTSKISLTTKFGRLAEKLTASHHGRYRVIKSLTEDTYYCHDMLKPVAIAEEVSTEVRGLLMMEAVKEEDGVITLLSTAEVRPE